MKKKHRKITVRELDFIYWHSAIRDKKKWNLIAHQLIFSPKRKQAHKMVLEFSPNECEKCFVENPVLDSSKFTLLHQKEGAPENPMPTIYYDTDHLYSAKARKNGEDVVVNWGKPKTVSEIIAHLLDNGWNLTAHGTETRSGWDILRQMSYTDIVPCISWSW